MSKTIEKRMEELSSRMEKRFGKEALIRLDGKGPAEPLEVISTGSIGVDLALGVGGLPRGRIVEVFGPESSGKTTLALQVVAAAQKAGGLAAFIDAEHALDLKYGGQLGVEKSQLLLSQPQCGEEALEIVDALVESKEVAVIVVDSVAALVPRAELEGEMGDPHMALQARLMSQAMRKLTPIAKKGGTLILFINQLRQRIGVMFGNPETTTGGNALKYYASVRLDIRRIGAVKDGEKVLGNRTRVKVVKNKVAPPFQEAEFDIRYGLGVDKVAELLELGVERGVIEKGGSSYRFEGQGLGQGREAALARLREDGALYEAVLRRLGTGVAAVAVNDVPVLDHAVNV